MRLLAAIAAATWLLAAGTAGAAQRYASPAGSGTVCSQASPCSLKTALGEAPDNSEVIVTPGTYPVTEEIVVPFRQNLSVHGQSTGHPPLIEGAVAGILIDDIEGSGVTYSDLEIVNTAGSGMACGTGVAIDRLVASGTGESRYGLGLYDTCSVRDSLLRATGTLSSGLRSSGGSPADTAVARNVTAIASGPESAGVVTEWLSLFPGSGQHTLDLKNSIARGQGVDVAAREFSLPFPMAPSGFGIAAVSHSSFATSSAAGSARVEDLGGNQKAAPLFVDAETGDYREAPGSPTIDAGAAGELGSLDLAGNPRALGDAPDIGAYEFLPPVCGNCGAPGGVRSIAIAPKRFRAHRSGGPVVPGGGVLKSKPPVGATVTYAMSGPATVEFSVSRRVPGRKVGKVCKRGASASVRRGRCFFYVPLKGSFAQQGATGSNDFVFSGRIGGKTLRPGAYKLTALAGHLVSAAFEIGGLPKRRHRR